MPIQVTTQLPTGPTPSLDNTTEDEIEATWSDVSNYGDYHVQIREEGESSWSASAAGFDETVVDHDTLQTTFGGLDDGTTYEVRVRAETEHADGDWSTPAATTTIFPAPDALQVDDRFDVVQLSYTDNADAETEVQLQRSPSGEGNWTTINTYPPDTTSVVDDTRVYYQAFDYRIRQVTDDGSAISNTVTTTPRPSDRPPKINAKGWTVVVEHPVTERKLHPDVLDEPTKLPSLNSLPEIRIPVRKSDVWSLPEMDDDPQMDVWLDGEKQPIDELREVEQRQDRTILHGVGGVELEQRVRAAYRTERPTVAVDDLVSDETGYATDVDTPQSGGQDDAVMQNPDTTTELENVLNIADTTPAAIQSGEVTTLQTCFVPNFSEFSSGGTTNNFSDDQYTEGLGWEFEPFEMQDTDGDGEDERVEAELEVTISTDYTIPEANNVTQSTLAFRGETDNTTQDTLRLAIYVDGNFQDAIEPNWDIDDWDTFNLFSTGELPADDYTITFVRTDDAQDANIRLDTIAFHDNRFTYNFDTSLNEPGGHLDGPETRPDSVAIEPGDAITPFSVIGGEASLTIDDTSGDQRLQVSNDQGQNWYPDDGTEQNTDTVDVDFPGVGSQIRLRTDLSRWEPSGPRDATPRLGYAGQTIDAWGLLADLRLEPLLVDRVFDDSLESILTEIASTEFLWSYHLDDGTPTVSWTQPGQRESDNTPSFGDATITKEIADWETVTVKGASRSVSAEEFAASTGGTNLSNADIIPGSESIYDDAGINYDRGTDYEMDYRNGEAIATSGGQLTGGSTYNIDYRTEVSGSYTVQDASANPREFVEQVPSITSSRTAEQIAFILARRFSEPRWVGSLTIPRADVTFDPLDSLPLSNLDLPDEATPLEVRGQPQISPAGLELRVGSRGRLEESLSSVASRLQAVSERA